MKIKYETIIKSIREYLTKHPINERALIIGNTGVWTEGRNKFGEKTYTITYSGGEDRHHRKNDGTTQITFTEKTITEYDSIRKKFVEKKANAITHLHFDLLPYGVFDSDFQLHKGESFFNEEQLYGKLSPEDYQFFNDFSKLKMSTLGMEYNRYLRGDYDEHDFRMTMSLYIDEAESYQPYELLGKNSEEVGDYFLKENSRYSKIVEETDLNGYGDFFTARTVNELHSNDAKNKRVVSDKGYISETVGTIPDEYNDCLGMEEQPWLILTMYRDGNPANHGAYLGYAERKNHGTNFWEEVLRPPYSKSTRRIIDEKNRIIIQEPYDSESTWFPRRPKK